MAGLIVNGPGPGMLKMIASASVVALASRMDWRSDPGPLSSVLVTVKVAARLVCEERRRVNQSSEINFFIGTVLALTPSRRKAEQK